MSDELKSIVVLILTVAIFFATIAIGLGVAEYISDATARTCIENNGYWDDNTCTLYRESQ